jgi:hypothetical protein
MHYEATEPEPKSIFKNAALRKQFLVDVTESFEKALGHAELICLYQNFEPTFNKMAEGAEYDQMTLHIIQTRYKGFHERLDEQREWVHKLLLEQEERQLAL